MCKKTDQPITGLADRFEGSRHARFDAGRLEQRIRPHSAGGGHRTAATIIPMSSACGWRAQESTAGRCSGSSDDFGLRPAESPFNVHDVNATILRLIGLDHTRLTYLYQSRDMRLTDVHGEHEFTNKLIS